MKAKMRSHGEHLSTIEEEVVVVKKAEEKGKRRARNKWRGGKKKEKTVEAWGLCMCGVPREREKRNQLEWWHMTQGLRSSGNGCTQGSQSLLAKFLNPNLHFLLLS